MLVGSRLFRATLPEPFSLVILSRASSRALSAAEGRPGDTVTWDVNETETVVPTMTGQCGYSVFTFGSDSYPLAVGAISLIWHRGTNYIVDPMSYGLERKCLKFQS